jgi:hypothetical protein
MIGCDPDSVASIGYEFPAGLCAKGFREIRKFILQGDQTEADDPRNDPAGEDWPF